MDQIRISKRQDWRKLALIPALLLLAVLIAYLASQANPHHDAVSRVGLAAAPVAHSGQAWVPQGAPVLLPDRQMQRVGESADGVALFAAPVPLGGGGGLARPNLTDGPVYMRVGPDQYQRLMLAHVDRD